MHRMKLTKIFRAAVKSGEAPGFTALCLFTASTGGAALLNNQADGDPRFTLFAGCLCALGALALVCLVALIVDAVCKLNQKG